jgi:hypothetical protein
VFGTLADITNMSRFFTQRESLGHDYIKFNHVEHIVSNTNSVNNMLIKKKKLIIELPLRIEMSIIYKASMTTNLTDSTYVISGKLDSLAP